MVVHQGDEPDAVIPIKVVVGPDDIRRGDFAAQVDIVIGPQSVFLLTRFNRICEGPHVCDLHGVVAVIILIHANAKGVKHGCYAGTGDLGIMCLNGRNRVPSDLRPRSIVYFEVIGVQLDQARQKEIAFTVVPHGLSC